MLLAVSPRQKTSCRLLFRWTLFGGSVERNINIFKYLLLWRTISWLICVYIIATFCPIIKIVWAAVQYETIFSDLIGRYETYSQELVWCRPSTANKKLLHFSDKVLVNVTIISLNWLFSTLARQLLWGGLAMCYLFFAFSLLTCKSH